ncbi:unnamed protein product [Staurois parvus]|uniref:Uncharacterized protein n=1 Tax=Staurois parvus TaxID=386267 RepID=A0ABN9C8D7_9NEOB|nr:unnamed protein product [Staurois parvus]
MQHCTQMNFLPFFLDR